MKLAFASSKGGVGKSTTCACIAAALALRGDNVLIIELDQNKPLVRWSKKTGIRTLTVQPVSLDDFNDIYRKANRSGHYDHILMDVAGAREFSLFRAMSKADLVIIPSKPSPLDLREAIVTVKDLLDVAETKRRTIPYRILLTEVHPLRTKVESFIRDEVKNAGLDIFSTSLIARTSYREMFLNGQVPTLSEPEKAGEEIETLLEQIEDICNSNAPLLEAAE